MTTDPLKWQAPKPKRSAIQWLLDSDPSVRWQAMRDLTDAPDEEIAAERAKIATDGWGATLLAAQSEDGTWPGDPRFPEWPGLYRYAMRLLGHASLAEDCVAETFTRFLKALQTRQGPRDHLQAYLYRIAHNWIVDLYCDYKETIELSEAMHCEKILEEEATKRIQQQQVRKALRSLTPDQQQVISLKYLESWSNEEIAHALHKPVGAVKSLQHRALASLLRLLTEKSE